jgi:hypothetical protein
MGRTPLVWPFAGMAAYGDRLCEIKGGPQAKICYNRKKSSEMTDAVKSTNVEHFVTGT